MEASAGMPPSEVQEDVGKTRSGTDRQNVGNICKACDAIVPEECVACPNCGHSVDSGSPILARLQIGLSGVECQSCRYENEAGNAVCAGCSADLSQQGGAKSLQHKRKETHGKILTQLDDLLVARVASVPPASVPTDPQQYLRFVGEGGIVSGEHLACAVSLLSRIDVTTMQSAHDRRTHQSLLELYNAAEKSFDAYRTAASVVPPMQFTEFHALLKAYLGAVLEIYLHGARAHFSLTLRKAGEEQRELQRAVDNALEASERLAEVFQRLDLSGVESGNLQGRLVNLAGLGAEYTRGEGVDTAAVLASLLAKHGTLPAAGQAVYALLRDLFETDLASLSEEESLGLIHMAVPLVASDNSVAVRRRARIFADVMRAANASFPIEVGGATRRALSEIMEARTYMLTIAEQFRALAQLKLSREARRFMLKDAYDNIAEYVWRRLTSLFIYAMFLLEGSSLTYEDVAERTGFGGKVQWLLQRPDSSIALALQGVSDLMRNAGSHGAVDVSGSDIHFTNLNPTAGAQTTETLSDEEFEAWVSAIVDTCLALGTAVDVFVLEHWNEFAPTLRTIRPARRLAADILVALLGLWQLLDARVEFDGERVELQARLADAEDSRPCKDFLQLFAILATLMPDIEEASISVLGRERVVCTLHARLGPFREFQSAPDDVKDILVLSSMFASEAITAGETPSEPTIKYRGTIVFNLSHQLMVDMATLGQARERGADGRDTYLQLLECMQARAAAYRRVLLQAPVPAGEDRVRNELLDAIRRFDLGLRGHLRAARAGNWSRVESPSADFLSAGLAVTRIREQTLNDARSVNGEV